MEQRRTGGTIKEGVSGDVMIKKQGEEERDEMNFCTCLCKLSSSNWEETDAARTAKFGCIHSGGEETRGENNTQDHKPS